MKPLFLALLNWLSTLCRSRVSMQLEIVALRHQLTVYQRSIKRPRIQPGDRLVWVCLSRFWSGWQTALAFVQPRTVTEWQRRRFRAHWARLSRSRTPGRPAIAKEIRDLIRQMSKANLLWGSPRIQGELKKIGINLAKSTIEKYRIVHRSPPSPNPATR